MFKISLLNYYNNYQNLMNYNNHKIQKNKFQDFLFKSKIIIIIYLIR